MKTFGVVVPTPMTSMYRWVGQDGLVSWIDASRRFASFQEAEAYIAAHPEYKETYVSDWCGTAFANFVSPSPIESR
jgi:hypothetical protein